VAVKRPLVEEFHEKTKAGGPEMTLLFSDYANLPSFVRNDLDTSKGLGYFNEVKTEVVKQNETMIKVAYSDVNGIYMSIDYAAFKREKPEAHIMLEQVCKKAYDYHINHPKVGLTV
jgi:hypothetical protein